MEWNLNPHLSLHIHIISDAPFSCSICFPYLPSHLLCSSHMDPLYIPWTHQVSPYLKTFALALSYVWKTCPSSLHSWLFYDIDISTKGHLFIGAFSEHTILSSHSLSVLLIVINSVPLATVWFFPRFLLLFIQCLLLKC